jgi:hypothetical protein
MPGVDSKTTDRIALVTGANTGNNRGTQTVEEGAAEAIRLALLPADGPSGGFFSSAGPVAW